MAKVCVTSKANIESVSRPFSTTTPNLAAIWHLCIPTKQSALIGPSTVRL